MKKHISIFALLLCAFAAFAADSGDVMRLTPVGYRLGASGDVTAYDPSVVTVTPGDTSIVSSNKPVTLTATLNRDYRVVCWQKFDVDPTIRTTADPIEVFGEGNETVSVGFNPNVTWMYVTVVVEYDPVRTVKASVSSFGEGEVTVSPVKDKYLKGDTITLTASPAGGYDFVRWSDGFADHVRTLTVSNDVDLTAYIEPKANRATFSAGEEAVLGITEKLIRFGCAYGELPVPVRVGQVFVGWKDEFGTMITSESISARAGDHVLTAVWEIPPESYIVVFDANGGTGLQTRVEQKFEVGVAQKLRINTFYKQGSVFVGWNQNDKAEEKQFADEQIVQNLAAAGGMMTLFAVWRAEQVAYTVHFDKNAADATGTMSDQQFAGGEEKHLSGCTFKREGWTFLGWSTDPKALEPAYQDREKVQDLTMEKGGKVDLYAVWTRNPVYYVNYRMMDRDTEPWKSEAVEQGKEYTLSGTNGLARTGYTFAGWTNGMARVIYPAGKKCTTQELEKMVDDGDTITFVAVWKPITYTLKFDGNGATTCTVGTETLEYDDIRLPYSINVNRVSADRGPETVRTNYTLIGWNRDSAGKGEMFELGVDDKKPPLYQTITITNNLIATNGTVTLYAIWQGNPQKVTIIGVGTTNVAYGSQLQQPPDPVKPGYELSAWTNEFGVVQDFPITVTNSFSLFPDMRPIAYSVQFLGTDGTYETEGEMEPQEFTYDMAQTLTSNGFTRTGYTFANWTNEVGKIFADGAQVKNLATDDGAVVNLYATWTMNPRYYAVRFNPNGGAGEAYTQNILCGRETALTSNRFVRTGYGFANWTNATGTAYADGEKVTDLAAENATNDLYAAWTPNKYWVAFEGNGADGGKMGNQEFTYDVAQALTSNAFTRTGHAFAGWATNATGAAAVYGDGAVVSNLTAEADATNTLWATWTAKSYEISFNSAGGSAVGPVTNEFGKAVSAPTPTKKGHQFDGWYEGEVKFDFTSMPARNVRLTAHWTANAYTVEFRGPGDAYTQGFTYDEPKELEANRFTAPEMMVFDRWTNTVDSATYADCETVCNLATGGVFTLYATWKEAPSYTVAFDGNGADGGSTATKRFECGTGGKLPANGFTRTGYAFGQWTNRVNGATYADGAPFTEDLAPTNETATLSALWTPNSYWVKFDANGGAGEMDNQAFTYDVAEALTSNAFTKTGYSFDGWKTNETGSAVFTDKAVVSNLTTEANATNTLWATWTANHYTVRFNPNGGSGDVTTQGFTYDQPQNLADNAFDPPEPLKSFAGWATNETGKAVYANGAEVQNLTAEAGGTVNLYAVWGDDSYTVIFDGNGATGGSMDPQVFKHGGTDTLTPNAYVRTGCGFTNWTNDSNKVYSDGASFTAPATGSGETLYAVWTNCVYYCRFDDEKDGPYHYEDNVGERSPTKPKLGYVFLGWTNETGIVDLKTFKMPDHDVAFGSKWEPITYTVKFHGGDGSQGTMDPQAFTYDVEQALSSNKFTRAGYEFTQWTNTEGKVFTDGQNVKNLAETDGAEVMLYTVWQETGNPLAIALGLDANFDVEVSDEGAWTVIGEPKEKNGLQRTSASPGGTLRVTVPSGGMLAIGFDAGGSIINGLTYSDGSHSATKKNSGNYSIGVESACTVTFSGTPDSECTWTLKNFTWTAK